eukprot:TRINITY_DN31883_c0_g1_i1.p1 TRINITY_DN31883_c0_g1~~TRINITY_DN31883_c0_g1_i1.p1  ORF type:complete len:267 (+),score=88.06 TRINITY_DN31883_c0_g1_i1:180-980(+)
MSVTLHMNACSSPCLAVWVLLRAAGVKPDIKSYDLRTGETLSDEFRSLNPKHTIPTIEHDGLVLWESNAIMRYACEAFPSARQFYPEGGHSKARCDLILDWKSTSLYKNVAMTVYPAMGFGVLPEAQVEKAYLDLTNEGDGDLWVLEHTFLDGKDFVCGGTVTIADIAVMACLKVLEYREDIPISAALQRYKQRVAEATDFETYANGAEMHFGWNQLVGVIRYGFFPWLARRALSALLSPPSVAAAGVALLAYFYWASQSAVTDSS